MRGGWEGGLEIKIDSTQPSFSYRWYQALQLSESLESEGFLIWGIVSLGRGGRRRNDPCCPQFPTRGIRHHVCDLGADVAIFVLPEQLVVDVILLLLPHTQLGPRVPTAAIHVYHPAVHLTLDVAILGRAGGGRGWK